MKNYLCRSKYSSLKIYKLDRALLKRLTVFTLFVLLIGCSNNSYTPKPSGNNRIEEPQYEYKEYDASMLSFEYSDIAHVEKVDIKKSEYWFNIVYPQYKAVIYCSYLRIDKNHLSKVLEDSYHLAYSHTIKADGINQIVYSDPETGIGGMIYEIEGDVATPIQFFVTDSLSNFLRGSLYYTQNVDLDSIAPVTNFIEKDIMQLIRTTKFHNKQ